MPIDAVAEVRRRLLTLVAAQPILFRRGLHCPGLRLDRAQALPLRELQEIVLRRRIGIHDFRDHGDLLQRQRAAHERVGQLLLVAEPPRRLDRRRRLTHRRARSRGHEMRRVRCPERACSPRASTTRANTVRPASASFDSRVTTSSVRNTSALSTWSRSSPRTTPSSCVAAASSECTSPATSPPSARPPRIRGSHRGKSQLLRAHRHPITGV